MGWEVSKLPKIAINFVLLLMQRKRLLCSNTQEPFSLPTPQDIPEKTTEQGRLFCFGLSRGSGTQFGFGIIISGRGIKKNSTSVYIPTLIVGVRSRYIWRIND